MQKQARLFLSRAAAHKRWLLWQVIVIATVIVSVMLVVVMPVVSLQLRKIERLELLRVYGRGKGVLVASDMERLMMAQEVPAVVSTAVITTPTPPCRCGRVRWTSCGRRSAGTSATSTTSLSPAASL